MEIDFMGLNSPKSKLEQESSEISHIDTEKFDEIHVFDLKVGGVEVSLSLSRSSSLNLSEKKKWESAASAKLISRPSTVYRLAAYNGQKTQQPNTLLVAPTSFHHRAAGGFPYDLNEAAADNLRSMSQLSGEHPASLTMLYPTCPNVFTEPQRAKNSVYICGNASTIGGYTPTVAMARRATLVRFLEKRLHRMNQGRGCHLMGRPPVSATTSQVQTAGNKNIKQKNNHKRRS